MTDKTYEQMLKMLTEDDRICSYGAQIPHRPLDVQ